MNAVIQLGATPLLSAGVATADPLNLGQELDVLDAAGVTVVHVDIMDGVFCPLTTTAAPALVRALCARFTVDVHLMVERPLEQAHIWVEAGARALTFQLESARHAHRLLASIDVGATMRGVALLPGTPVAAVEPLLEDLELVLLLAVDPGWSGQRFQPRTVERVREARALLGHRDVLLSVDGAITADVVPALIDAGADVIVVGSAIFDGGDASANVRRLVAQLR